MVERSLVLIKPDGVGRRLVGKVLARFEERGFVVRALRMFQMTDAMADRHYQEHVSKPFYPSLRTFITSGPVVGFVLEGPQTISVVRKMVGDTDATQAPSGTIRGDYALSKGENIIHASDSVESAAKEIAHFFPEL